jgi:hypothetical protein
VVTAAVAAFAVAAFDLTGRLSFGVRYRLGDQRLPR